MRLRVLVADQSEARFYDTQRVESGLRYVAQMLDSKAHLHDRDLVSDRPVRIFDHAAPPSGRRGAVAHHATGGEHTPRKLEALSFAARIAERLEMDLRDEQFDQLVVMAGPGFLGLLRQALPPSVQARIAAEVPKDLVHQTSSSVLEHLPREVFRQALQESAGWRP